MKNKQEKMEKDIMKISTNIPSLKGTLQIPGSKSESNRVLIIRALCQDDFRINNLSKAEDTVLMKRILTEMHQNINVANAGTVLRFLTAYLSQKEGEWIIDGSERMQQRPIGILVEALKILGAQIKYLDKTGFPPIRITGRILTGKRITVDSTISSQFISALLMIAPSMQNGLKLTTKGKIASLPYIKMTLQIMEHFGIEYKWMGNTIAIPHQRYVPANYHVESDWSSAAYWYSIAALSEPVDLKMKFFRKNSFQGDSIIQKIMIPFGVETNYEDNTIKLSRCKATIKTFEHNFFHTPDLAQPIIVLCAAMNIKAKLKGLNNLIYKETDRINAMQRELVKVNKSLKLHRGIYFLQNCNNRYGLLKNRDSIAFDTYGDHRMALSFVIFAFKYSSIIINDPMVVKKSYPGFWKDLSKKGFKITMNNDIHKILY